MMRTRWVGVTVDDAIYHSLARLLSLWDSAAQARLDRLGNGPFLSMRDPPRGRRGGELQAARRGRAANGRKPWRAMLRPRRTPFRNCWSATPASSATGRRCGTRTWASGRPGPGRRCSTRCAPMRSGCTAWGCKRGDTIAIVGANRPKLYWSVTAAQMLGAVPVPVYADAVADELAYVLAHAEVRFAAVEDQEQVDKILSVSERLPKLEKMVYDEPQGPARLRPHQSARDRRRDRRRPRGAGAGRYARRLARRRDRRRQGLRHLGHPLHLGHHRPVEGRGAVGGALHPRRLRHGRLRQARPSTTRRWPICRSPGSATTISTTCRA